jgi:hypothetical protein
MLKLRYEGGDECETGEGDKVTEIWFECDRTADDQNAKPEIFEVCYLLISFGFSVCFSSLLINKSRSWFRGFLNGSF